VALRERTRRHGRRGVPSNEIGSKEVVRVGDEREPDQDGTRREDDQALEEIRQLFARYRRIARHGMVAEREDTVEDADEAARA
jgi:hypothetical protein